MSYKLYVESHLSTRLLCSLSGLLIPICMSSIKFPWSELPERKYKSKMGFFYLCRKAYLLCCVNES